MINKIKKRSYIFMIPILLIGTLTACSNKNNNSNDNHLDKSRTEYVSNAKPVKKDEILNKLINYTDQESGGPNGNYYFDNGKADLSGFKHMNAGNYQFSSDNHGRSSIAKAVLTYSQYRNSQGSRQGSPLDPPAWPIDNPKVAITYGLTGRIYHGYLYNRSHSIGDSLLGEKSYTSKYNFTTGTRPQNVGANQNGGMRHTEEIAEDYWSSHPKSKTVIYYKTTPLYNGNETMPRGSIVDVKSSDGVLNNEVIVLNSVEGIKINYNNGNSNANPLTYDHKSTDSVKNTQTEAKSNKLDSKSSKWHSAKKGMVFVSKTNKYYSKVLNSSDYNYISFAKAKSQGAMPAKRGNAYAQP